MDELDKAMKETELALNEMEKRRNEFNAAHQERIQELNGIIKSFNSSNNVISDEIAKTHRENAKELGNISRELDSLLGDTKPSKHNDALLAQLHDENEYLDWLWAAEHPTDYNDCP